jgi:hypothetical protein
MIRKRIIVADIAVADIAATLIVTGDPVALILSGNTETSPRSSAQGEQN